MVGFVDKLTIWPRVTNNYSALWELQFGNLRLNSFVRQCNPFNFYNLISIGGAVNVWPQPEIALNPAMAQADNGFVELILFNFLAKCSRHLERH